MNLTHIPPAESASSSPSIELMMDGLEVNEEVENIRRKLMPDLDDHDHNHEECLSLHTSLEAWRVTSQADATRLVNTILHPGDRENSTLLVLDLDPEGLPYGPPLLVEGCDWSMSAQERVRLLVTALMSVEGTALIALGCPEPLSEFQASAWRHAADMVCAMFGVPLGYLIAASPHRVDVAASGSD